MICNTDPPPGTVSADVLAGLSRPRKRLPAKYFYDDAGSRLFDRDHASWPSIT